MNPDLITLLLFAAAALLLGEALNRQSRRRR